MPSTSHLREGDVDRVLDVIGASPHDDPGPAMPWGTMARLLGMIRCDDDCQYQQLDVTHERTTLCQTLAPDGGRDLWDAAQHDPALVARLDAEEEERQWWGFFRTDPMCSYPQRSGDRRGVFHTGDFFPTALDLRDRAARRDLGTSVSVLVVQLPAPVGVEHRLTFARTGAPFSERDRQVLDLLRPHLHEIRLDAERRRAGVPRLTPREWEVLSLVGAGLSLTDVAARLVLSVGTVRKHAEHIRERLGVHSVAAAATKALPHAPGARKVPPRPATTAPAGDTRPG
jgi:DNA-binding CsgD family transcriptional regulator